MSKPTLADQIRAMGICPAPWLDMKRSEAIAHDGAMEENERLQPLVELCAEMAEALEWYAERENYAYVANKYDVDADTLVIAHADTPEVARDTLSKARELVGEK